jgi:transcriptional regulator with XRE-family HTH domain
MSLGMKILKLMKENNITQENLASVLGLSQKAIHDIVSGKTKKIDFFLVCKISKIFNVSIDYFYEIISDEDDLINLSLNQRPENILVEIKRKLDAIEKKIDLE